MFKKWGLNKGYSLTEIMIAGAIFSVVAVMSLPFVLKTVETNENANWRSAVLRMFAVP